MGGFRGDGGGEQGSREEEEGDREMIGKIHYSWGVAHPLPVDSSRCHQLVLSNQWVYLNRAKDTNKKGRRKRKKNIQIPAERGLDRNTGGGNTAPVLKLAAVKNKGAS